MNATRSILYGLLLLVSLAVPTVAIAQSVPGRIADSFTNAAKRTDAPTLPAQIKGGANACCAGPAHSAPPVQPVMAPQINEAAVKARQAQQQQQAQIALDTARRDEAQKIAKRSEEAAIRQSREAESLAAQRKATEAKITEQRIQSEAVQLSRQTSTTTASGPASASAIDAQRLRDVARNLPVGHAKDQVGAAIWRAEREASNKQFRKINAENDRLFQQKRLDNEAALRKAQGDAARIDSAKRNEARAISERTTNERRTLEKRRIDDEALAAQKSSNDELQSRKAKEAQAAHQQKHADEQATAKQLADKQAAQEAKRVNEQANAKRMADDAAFQERKRLEALSTQNVPSGVSPNVGLSSRGLRPAPGTRVKPEGVPDAWKIKETDTRGGVLFKDPTRPHDQDSVRIMQAKPDSIFVNQRSHYVVWKKGGHTLDKDGNKAIKYSDDAHIPVTEFKFSSHVYKKRKVD